MTQIGKQKEEDEDIIRIEFMTRRTLI